MKAKTFDEARTDGQVRGKRYTPWIALLAICLSWSMLALTSEPPARLAAIQAPAAPATLDYDEVDAGDFPIIASIVRVWDENSLPVGGLTEQNFLVFEDDVRQLPITVEEFGGDSGGVSVVLVMDVSGSMREEIDDAKNAANLFVDLLREYDQAALISFNANVLIEQGFTKDKLLLQQKINALQLEDGTAVYDATVEAINLANTVEGKRAIVLLTDGRDGNSRTRFRDALALVSQSDIPIYTIGLGIRQGRGDEELMAFADSSGGRYYESPTTSELEGIYREIAYLISSYYYRILYTTSNCSEDGTTRAVRIEVQADGSVARGNNQYVAPGYSVALRPTSAGRPNPGSEFTLAISVAPTSRALFNLFEAQLRVRYDPQHVQVKQPAAQNITPGPLLGVPAQATLTPSVDANAGIVDLQFRRNDGAGPAAGSGVIASIVFTTSMEMPDSTQLPFELEIVAARDVRGCDVALTADSHAVYSDGMIVWPGDTDFNGRVELADVLVLGVYWDMLGPARPVTDPLTWRPQLARRFPLLPATHADADGGGNISERDIVPIGLNWGKTRQESVPSAGKVTAALPDGDVRLEVVPGESPGSFRAQVHYSPAQQAPLAGFTFRLRYPAAQIAIASARPGAAWRQSPLSVSNDNQRNGVFAMGLMMPAGSPLVDEGGIVAEIVLQAQNGQQAPGGLELYQIGLVAADGQVREVTPQLEPSPNGEVPAEFTLFPAYPNPFNPETTIRYFVPQDATVSVRIYNTAGREIRSFAPLQQERGYHTLRWDGRDSQGQRAGSGAYFVRLQAASRDGAVSEARQRVTLIK